MNELEFIFGILTLVATFILVIGGLGLHYDSLAKDKKIEMLESELKDLRIKKVRKTNSDRYKNKKLVEKTKTVSKSRGRV